MRASGSPLYGQNDGPNAVERRPGHSSSWRRFWNELRRPLTDAPLRLQLNTSLKQCRNRVNLVVWWVVARAGPQSHAAAPTAETVAPGESVRKALLGCSYPLPCLDS